MGGNIYFIGHISVDRVENVNGVRVQPGGAALYAAVAAKTLFSNVRLVSAVSKNYKFVDVLKPFLSRYIRFSKMPSTEFHIKYNERWEARYLKAEHGAGSRISISKRTLEGLGPEDMVHFSPIRPRRAQKMVDGIKRSSPKTCISVNTWIDYIVKSKTNKRILREMAEKVDFFILNDSEAKTLAETDSLSTAIRLLKARMLVVTLGELGAIISREDGEIQMVPALNHPVKGVVDTTGSGDTWCGAFVAAYKLTNDLMKSVTVASIISSIKCTNWGFTSLLNLRFSDVNDVIEYVIGLREGSLQKRISDYTK
ncbi:MAG: carbohydrate kinase family protein [Candidatus Bathyarchaeia archaeon]